MSIVVRPALEHEIDAICDLLHANMSARISKDRWRRLLDYPWRPPDADRGLVAADGGRIVGFLGRVFADRPVDGRLHRFCNICAWYLLKDYRGRGIGQALQTESVADATMTYTIVTPTAGTTEAFGRSGFCALDTERYVLRRSSAPASPLEAIEGPEAVGEFLEPAERAILEDHRAYNLRHVLFRTGDAACYLILQVKKKGADIEYHEVMHASDADFLAAHADRMANILLPAGAAVFGIDKRLVPATARWEQEPIWQPCIYRSSVLDRSRIDHLYNEAVLLDLKLP